MRQCPFDGCSKKIKSDKFACAHHWFSLSAKHRAMIWRCWEEYQRGEIGPVVLQREQQVVLDQAQGKAAAR